jgi:hypothetical protein
MDAPLTKKTSMTAMTKEGSAKAGQSIMDSACFQKRSDATVV